MPLLLPVRIHPEGWRFIGIFAALAFALFFVFQPLGWLALTLTGGALISFEAPNVITPTQEGLVVSPGDGIVCAIKSVPPPLEFDMGKAPRFRVSIFLNVFDVHVNRLPVGGKIVKSIYHPGQFFNAALDKASDSNERQSLVIQLADHTKVAVVQIAGLIARRIVCNVKEGETIETGAVYGIIRFGSRQIFTCRKASFPLLLKGNA